jgi:hypothetical protein
MIVGNLSIIVISFISHPSGSFRMLVASRIPYILPFCDLSDRTEQLACNDLTIKPIGSPVSAWLPQVCVKRGGMYVKGSASIMLECEF